MRKDRSAKLPEVGNKQNRISEGTSIVGEIKSESDFRIDGKLEGKIESTGKVVIGKNGLLKGTLICKEADLEGIVDGNLNVEGLLNLRASAVVKGDVATGRLAVEPGADFNASCNMGNGVKNLSNDDVRKETGKSA
ncbi:cytoskeletal protein CcmA (bactofilin family) [Leeuwenhoekiella aestuarii]|uniref:Cytoskeletal protein CcmA (Bactofilin family) n=1 Tax=Leeuwenhoekiella aestuarii TaxID=2249426 RepID=A0A4Q0NZA1_9FLAO|nr:polymer-forming cytoskeletal protein [Leeuwenhoekiella aestuarii]RXG17905.1 cytoskeletal protein CcmA (bactofilin family) [Leeuwenhoekiella aestuarii]RXG19234.1 cytoskeletal protein CcmA (bactofilin family) [Leeuwenhoekiella aestuarii]